MNSSSKKTSSPIKTLAALAPLSVLASGCAGAGAMLADNVLQNTGIKNLMPQSKSSQPGSATVLGIDSNMPQVLATLGQGTKLDIDDVMSDDVDGADAALALIERGRVAQISGDPARSAAEFKEAITKIKEFEERAKVSASDIASHAAALVVNDTVIPYEPAGFEKVLVYHFQAINHLMQGDIEAAGVEVRRANAEQELALKAHQQELDKAKSEAQSKGFKSSDLSGGINKMLGSSATDVANQVKNSFQNAYTFYMSGVIHELAGEPNDAYIDYKKALEIAPKNTTVQRDVARLAKQLQMTDDIQRLSKRFPQSFSKAGPLDSSKGEVIVLFEDGLVPEKTAVSFPLPIPIPSAPGLTAIAFPTFKASLIPARPLTLRASGRDLAKSEQICAIDALAVKAFQESAPAMITRQIVRAAIKGTAASMASKHASGLAGAAVSLYNVATERADTRSWRSLPHTAQVVRASVKPGETLELVHPFTGLRSQVIVSSEAGKKTVVRVTRIGDQLFVQSVSL